MLYCCFHSDSWSATACLQHQQAFSLVSCSTPKSLWILSAGLGGKSSTWVWNPSWTILLLASPSSFKLICYWSKTGLPINFKILSNSSYLLVLWLVWHLFSHGLPYVIQFICLTSPWNSGHMTALQFQFSDGFKKELCSFQTFSFFLITNCGNGIFAALHTLSRS